MAQTNTQKREKNACDCMYVCVCAFNSESD